MNICCTLVYPTSFASHPPIASQTRSLELHLDIEIRTLLVFPLFFLQGLHFFSYNIHDLSIFRTVAKSEVTSSRRSVLRTSKSVHKRCDQIHIFSYASRIHVQMNFSRPKALRTVTMEVLQCSPRRSLRPKPQQSEIALFQLHFSS